MANYPQQIYQLDENKPNVVVITLQTSNVDGEPILASQVEAARNAAVSVLELLGAEVANNSTVFTLDKSKKETILRVDVSTDESEEETDTDVDEEENGEN